MSQLSSQTKHSTLILLGFEKRWQRILWRGNECNAPCFRWTNCRGACHVHHRHPRYIGADVCFAKVLSLPTKDFTKTLGHVQAYNMTLFDCWNAWSRTLSCLAGICAADGNGSVFLATRLIPLEMSSGPKVLATALLQVANKTDSIPFALVAGGKVSKVDRVQCCEPSLAQGSVASCLGQCVNDTATVAEKTVMYTALTKANQYLRDIVPDSGCYFNEADINEPNSRRHCLAHTIID